MKTFLLTGIALFGLLLVFESCECGERTTFYQREFRKMIPPVRVAEKSNSYILLRDGKSNELCIKSQTAGHWGDSIIRNFDVGDVLKQSKPKVVAPSEKKVKTSTPEKKGWID